MSCAVVYLEHALCPHKRATLCADPAPIRQFAPEWRRPHIALLDGQPVLRADWGRPVPHGSVLAFVDVNAIPAGGGDGSNPLRIVAMLAVMYFAGPAAGALNNALGLGLATDSFAFAMLKGAVGLIGSALVNAMIPPPKPPTPQMAAQLAAPSPTYSLQAQGNTARLEAAIPEHFGRLMAYPDFGAQPYAEYVGNEMFLYQLFVIGRGEYDLEAIRIEDTDISSFDDIDYEVVAPGGSITLFPASVTTSSEVSGQDLPTSTAIGPFTANAAGTDAIALGVDLIYPRGLYLAGGDGSLAEVSVVVDVEAREIDDSGTAVGSWVTVGSETVTAATTTPQRRSFRYNVAAGRYEVRVTRTDTEQTGVEYGHDVVWGGLRAYLEDTADYGDVTLLPMRMRASSQLSAQASRKVNIIATRKLPTWNGSAWSANTATRSIAWALAYAAKQVGLADDEIDLPTLLTYDSTWAARGDTFDARFDNFLTFWEAAQKIAAAGRARPFLQAGILRVVRDEAQTVPVQMYSMRNIVRGSFSIDYLMPSPETADCVDVSYFDSAVWAPRKVRAALPGSSEAKPGRVDLFGVTSREQAYREGMYYAASNRYRRRLIHFRTEMEGFIPSLGDLIAVQHDMPAWGQHAEVTGLRTATNLLRYSSQLDQSVWVKTGAAVTANAGADHVGGTSADRLIEDTSVGNHLAQAVATDAGLARYTLSFYARAAGRSKVRARISRSTLFSATFDLSAGTSVSTTTNNTQTMTAVSSGVYRCTMTTDFSTTVGTGLVTFFLDNGAGVSYLGDGVSGIDIWGCQLEPTTTASVLTDTGGTAIVASTVLTVSEPLTWTDGATHYAGLRKPDGSIDGPVVVTGAGATLVPASSLTFTPYTGGAMERAHLAFGPSASEWRQYARLLSAKPVGVNQVEIEAVAEDDNVHTAEDGITTPTAPTSALANYTAAPSIAGLIGRSKPSDPSVMLLSWQPSPWAQYYLVELSADGENWTRVGEPSGANFSATAIYGAATIARVAAVNIARGPWVQIDYGGVADYMWNAVDTTLMWGTSTDPMWSL